MSPAERRLWQVLRMRPGGFKFRRRHLIEPYVLDFYCREAAVAVEVDGAAHDLGDRPQRDEARDAWLKQRGIRTVRIVAKDLVEELEAAVRLIELECRKRIP
jgi:very-short-patch-repair endonuclease